MRVIVSPSWSWGHHYLAVEPTHFRVDYAINPFMHLDDQPDPALAMEQWQHLVSTLRGLGARVDVLPQRADAPDMVYAMNLGLGVRGCDGTPRMVMSHMRYAERRMETSSAQAWFDERGYLTTRLGQDGVGPHLEAGDVFAFGDALVVGYGPRTEEAALNRLAADLGVRVRGLRITHPGMYHLDLAFCPLDERRAMVCPSALDEASAEALLALVPEPLVLTEEEALTTFCANSVVVGSHRRHAGLPRPGPGQLEDWGFTVVVVDMWRVPQGRRLGALPDQPRRRDAGPRPPGRARRRGRAAAGAGPAWPEAPTPSGHR